MNTKYTSISFDDFDHFVSNNGFVIFDDGRSREYTYKKDIVNGHFTIIIYSSIRKNGQTSRRYGQDAIRVVLKMNAPTPYVVWSGAHVKRIETWRRNLQARIEEARAQISDRNCPRCGALMVLRDGRNGLFYGCTNYAKTKCRGARSYTSQS